MGNYDDDKAFTEATEAYEKGDFKAAFELFSYAAKHDTDWADDYLGIMYGEGEGVEKDQDKSLYWHKRAGQKRRVSSKNSYNNIALQYERMGNRRRAFYWWNKSFAAGDKGAGLELAKRLLRNNRSDARKRAIALLEIAASAVEQLELSGDEIEEAQELLTDLQKQST